MEGDHSESDGQGNNNISTPDAIWERYVLRKGNAQVSEVWSNLFRTPKSAKVLFITGAGFDPRLKVAPDLIKKDADAASASVNALILQFDGYKLNKGLQKSTKENRDFLHKVFGSDNCIPFPVEVAAKTKSGKHGREAGANTSIFVSQELFKLVTLSDYDHIVLDISSIPRLVYLTLLLQTLGTILPERNRSAANIGDAPTFHVVVAEDSSLDSQIKSSELGRDVTNVVGFAAAKHQAAHANRSRVIMPVLGEGRVHQLEMVLRHQSDETENLGHVELCPVLPHPSANPRRGDELVKEYGSLLFDENHLDPRSFVYADEANPFEAYRQIRSTFQNYTDCFELLEGCRIEVVPLSSKLITIGTALACFEWHTSDILAPWRIVLSYPEPSHYLVSTDADLEESNAELTLALLTGLPYNETE